MVATNLEMLIGVGITIFLSLLLKIVGGGGRDMFFIYVIITSSIMIYVGLFPSWVGFVDIILIGYIIYDRYIGGNDN